MAYAAEPKTLPASPSPDAPQRVFFAVWPEASAMERLASIAMDVAQQTAGRPTACERMHVTLAFLGNVGAERLLALGQVGAEVATVTAPFSVVLDRLGTFPDAEVAWLGAARTPPALDRLAARLRGALASAAFRVDPRPYRVHVTLVRRCRHAVRARALESVEWPVQAMTLTASRLSPQGPTYQDLWCWPLAGTVDPP